MQSDKTIETYNKIASKYSGAHFDHFWVEEFDYFRKKISGRKIIDIGCGAGRDASVFIANGFDYTGIDASKGMLEVASRRVKKAKFLQMNYYNLKFPKESFDGFWAAASILHVPKNRARSVLIAINNIVRPNGVGFISVKEKTGLDEGLIVEDKYISRYFAFYDAEEFEKILEESGFKVIEMSSKIEDDEIKTKWLCFFVNKSPEKKGQKQND